MFDKIYKTIFAVSTRLVSFLIAIGLLGLCGLDIFLRIYKNKYVLIGAGSSVCLLGVGALLIISSRKLSIRSALQDTPKLYVPINPSDVPKRVYRLIQADLSKVANISLEAKPRPEDALDLGWGKIGSQLETIHYKTAAIQTFELLEKAATEISPFYRRDPSVSARRYIEMLIAETVLRKDVAHYYIDRYEQLRFGPRQMSEAEYKEFMKVFALLFRSLRYPELPG
ncbi:uncharacterized protein SPPG_00823 [Spizellomyces punctatus DAOM BR117]|uniref:Defect at low temperature protein 1 n=1 Tax=Spizellomyces punctatus (strain DAOM BR117) TaxID=645134 RepID=A0A0L0HW75_SPIPD|nr:uncharacterized protein SPPG_00823 [Spizellomyces punctatus DAOM BR117]KND05155.1 hypothetical protein SPPG_00823 [Spizellomyces punctatus DAOM BR117]|eukprot:XP_016613194.1 hypothetical protein SPPG_00823 [Spizellomyces punctatus DAOM BR117]